MDEELKKQEKDTAAGQVSINTGDGADYDNTMRALKRAQSTLPEFKSSYDEEISELYTQIVNRREFRYNPENDPVYGSYRERYAREGELAMRNTMGKTAALTGGYASSYSESAGQQQYEAYLKKLNDVLPELYSDAYERYKSEGETLKEQYDMASAAAKDEYGRYRDKISDEKDNRKIAVSENKLAFDKRQKNYENLYELISKIGYQPSAQQLREAGMTKELAEALREEYLKTHASGGGGVAYEDIPKPASKLDILLQAAEKNDRPRR